MDLWEWCVSAGEGGLPTATVAFPCPPVITGGLFFCVFSSPSTGNLGAVRLSGASLSDHLTELVCSLKAKRHSGLEFLQQRQSPLCFSSCCGRLGSLGSSPRKIIEMIVRRGLSSCPDTNPRVHVRYLITLGWFLPADFGAKLHVANYIAKKTYFHIWSGITNDFCQEVIMLPESGPGSVALWAGCLLVISILLAKVLWTSLSLSLWFSIFSFLRTCHLSSALPDDLGLYFLDLSIIPK